MSIKIGDRVRVYTSQLSFNGKVQGINPFGHLFVTEDGFNSCHHDSPFHVKQCRKLIRKNAAILERISALEESIQLILGKKERI